MTKAPIIGQQPLIGQPPAHVLRMLEESNQLGQRLAALDAFTETNVFEAMNEIDKHLMKIQAANMQAYLRVLVMRIERATPKAH